MRKRNVLLVTFILLCVANAITLFLLFSSSAESPRTTPGTRPIPRTRPTPLVRTKTREAFVLAISPELEMMGSSRSRGRGASS